MLDELCNKLDEYQEKTGDYSWYISSNSEKVSAVTEDEYGDFYLCSAYLSNAGRLVVLGEEKTLDEAFNIFIESIKKYFSLGY